MKKFAIKKYLRNQNSVRIMRSKRNSENDIRIKSKNNNSSSQTKSVIKNIRQRTKKIKVTLIASFLVPVALIVVLGITSYSNASKTITSNYENSTIGTSQAMAMYLGLISSEISSKVTEIANNPNLITYYGKVDKLNTSEGLELYRDVKATMVNMKASSDNIYSYHIFGEKGNSISSKGTLPPQMYKGYVQSPEGQEWNDNPSMKEKWSGNHQYIDETIGLSQEDYALSLTKRFAKGNGFIIVDIKKEVILEVLEKMEIGGNSLVAFVSPGGREITLSSSEGDEDIFWDEEFYIESQQSSESSGSSYVSYNKKNYLYIYDKIADTDMMLCILIPEADILAQVSWIKISTFIIVILASFIAIVIGTRIATGISREVNSIGKSFKKVSEGDFTTEFQTKRRDEFKILNGSALDMIRHMRGIIGEVKGFAGQVFDSSNGVSDKAKTTLTSTKDISSAMEEVGEGVVSQASDADKSLKEMSRFSEKINLVCENTEKMVLVADGAIDYVNNGKLIISDLSEKSGATAGVTKRIIREIEELEQQSNSIGSIVGAMNEIAEQTNLLSLNASIEAARAGEQGRGFAVVAAEIRRLAEQSVEASTRINGIIDAIRIKTKETVVSAKEAESFLASESEALGSTITVFNDVNNSVDHLVEGLKEIAKSMEDVGESKEVVLDSIKDISAVSQEVAASSEEIIATVNEQVTAITYLVEEAEDLAKKAESLEDAMQQFVV